MSYNTRVSGHSHNKTHHTSGCYRKCLNVAVGSSGHVMMWSSAQRLSVAGRVTITAPFTLRGRREQENWHMRENQIFFSF